MQVIEQLLLSPCRTMQPVSVLDFSHVHAGSQLLLFPHLRSLRVSHRYHIVCMGARLSGRQERSQHYLKHRSSCLLVRVYLPRSIRLSLHARLDCQEGNLNIFATSAVRYPCQLRQLYFLSPDFQRVMCTLSTMSIIIDCQVPLAL